MVLLTNYNLFLESVETHISECGLSHIQSGCFFESDLEKLFSEKSAAADRRIKRHLSVPCLFPSIQSVIPNYAPYTALSVCRDSTAGAYHDLVTGKCISRIARDVYSKEATGPLQNPGSTCTHVAAAEDSSSPLIFLGSAAGDINVIDLRVGVKGEFGHPVMSLNECHTGAISCMYNFRGFSFSLASGGFEDGRLNFFDLRYPYDHLKHPYAERPMPLRTFEMHMGNQTKYMDMDEMDKQILKHMKLGRINSMAVSHDEKLLAMCNGQSEVVICSTQEDIKVAKMGFLSSRDDYATSLAFSEHDTHLFCATYDILAGISRCKSHLKADKTSFPGTEPFNMVAWPLLNFQSNDWVTTPLTKFNYHRDYDLLEDMNHCSVLGEASGITPEEFSGDELDRPEEKKNAKRKPSSSAPRASDSPVGKANGLSKASNNTEPPYTDLRLIAHRKAEACHRSNRLKHTNKIDPLIFTVMGDYAVSTGGYETTNPTVDVWDPFRHVFFSSTSTPEVGPYTRFSPLPDPEGPL